MIFWMRGEEVKGEVVMFVRSTGICRKVMCWLGEKCVEVDVLQGVWNLY